jgi:hypothetical protein
MGVTYESIPDLINRNRDIARDNIDALTATYDMLYSQEKYWYGYPMYNQLQAGASPVRGTSKYPDGTWITWCNQFFYSLMEQLGYNVNIAYTPGGRYNTTVQNFYDNLLWLSSQPNPAVRKLDVNSAVTFANYGVPICVISPDDYGHIAVIWPTSTYSNIWLGQAGSQHLMENNNGIHPIYDSFGKWGYIPEFFYIPKKGG